MDRRAFSLNLLTLLTLAATVCLAGVVILLFLTPDLVPAALRPADPPAPATVSALALVTPTPAAVAYPTLPPEWTAVPSPTAPPTFTPDRYPTATSAVPAQLPDLSGTVQAGPDAHVRPEGNGLRLRAIPGTAGQVVAFLEALTPLEVIGRTRDNLWLQVVTPAGQRGWVMTEFLDVHITLVAVPETASAALAASPTPIPGTEARVADDGDNLRLRAAPGTAGAVVASLAAGTPLDIVGRTRDNGWLEVNAPQNLHGWVMARYVDILIDLRSVPVTGEPVNATAPPPTATPLSLAQVTSTSPPTPTHTPPPSPTPTATAAPPTPTHTSQPPSGSFVPGPYISGITEHARQIYLRGQALGNRANVFAKVGDSITVSSQFLYPIGAGQYNLRDYGHLAEVLAHFASGWARTGNAFANTSLAAKGGWTSYMVLSPSQADATHCRYNESPLLCEYRLTRPAIALIMLGTNDVLDTSIDGYRANLRRIVADSLQLGIIPVLSTIPPFLRPGYEGRADELNAVVVAVAQESDIPLWNYWAALQALPNRGLSSDGVHPSAAPNPADFTPENLQYGYTVRNLTALQALDAIWRQATW